MDTSDPQYLDVASALEKEIQGLAANTLLPTEIQLAKRFGVSRVTIRRAMDMLERSGLITRMRGRGTIVSPAKVTRRFGPLLTFERDLNEQGIAFETQILEYEMAPPPEAIRERLRLAAGEDAPFLSLVRLVDDRIICHDRRYYLPSVAGKFEDLVNREEGLRQGLEELVGLDIVEADWESEIIAASREVSKVLQVVPGTLVVCNTFTYFLTDGTPVEAGLMVYRVDRCKFRFYGQFGELKSSAERRGDAP